MTIRVAVSGVGGGVGQSILKGLTLTTLPVSVHPIDIQPLSAGLFRASGGTVLPAPEKPGALEKWASWLKEQRIEALFPGSDHDLLSLAAVRDRWEEQGVCRVFVSDLDTVEKCRDKARTGQMLLAAGLPFPKSIWDIEVNEAVRWAKSMGYPVILKPRDGYASRHLYRIKDEEELRFFFPRVPNPILQEYLQHDGREEEFTCAVFVDKTGTPVGTFMAKRDLSGGATYRAEVGVWPAIRELLLAVGSAVHPRGPLNVQLRMTKQGPVPFELNVRCSGTSGIRAYFGYNEPEMLLRHYLLGEALVPPTPRTGMVLRYWNEVFLEGVDRQTILERQVPFEVLRRKVFQDVSMRKQSFGKRGRHS